MSENALTAAERQSVKVRSFIAVVFVLHFDIHYWVAVEDEMQGFDTAVRSPVLPRRSMIDRHCSEIASARRSVHERMSSAG